MSLKCRICGFTHDSNLIDHIESKHAEIAMKDKDLDTLESYLVMFSADVDDVVTAKELSLREELNKNLGLNIPDRSDLDFMKPKRDTKLTADFLIFFCSFVNSYKEKSNNISFDGYCGVFNQRRDKSFELLVKNNNLRNFNLNEQLLKTYPCKAVREYISLRDSSESFNHEDLNITSEELYFCFFNGVLKIPTGKAVSLSNVVHRLEKLLSLSHELEDFSLPNKTSRNMYQEDEFDNESYCDLSETNGFEKEMHSYIDGHFGYIEEFYNLSYYLNGEPVPTILWYDVVYQDEEMMEQFLIQMAEYEAPHDTFRKYAKDMFGKDYWIKVNDLSKKHECLRNYREGDDGGGWEACADEPEWDDIKHSFSPEYVAVVESVRAREKKKKKN